MTRCDECLDEIPDKDPRFATYKTETPEPTATDPDGCRIMPRVIESIVCYDCADWYDDAVEIAGEP